MVKIIINADDLGLNPLVNSMIDEALAEGYITSSTILANSDSLDDVKRLVEKYPHASFGIHLNLTSGQSLTLSPIFKKYAIIDDDGYFIMKQSFRICPNANDELKQAIKEEWRAQIELLIENGFCISHADGHHHCHTWYGLSEVFCELMNDFAITKVRQKYRFPSKPTFLGMMKAILAKVSMFLGFKLYKYNDVFSKHFADECYYIAYNNSLTEAGIFSPTYFCSYKDMYNLYVSSRLHINDNSIIELMCHPGSERFRDEYEQIIRDVIGVNNGPMFHLVSYNQL